jgi:ATP-dependent Lon protease
VKKTERDTLTNLFFQFYTFIHFKMPFYPLPSAKKSKKRGSPAGSPPKDDDSSVDEKGNIKNLIDYDYEEETTESSLPSRKAKQAARRKIRRQLDVSSEDSQQTPPQISVKEKEKVQEKVQKKPVKRRIVVEDTEDEEEETEDESEEEIVYVKRKPSKNPKQVKKTKKRHVVEESSDEEYEDEEEYEDDETEDTEDEEEEDEDEQAITLMDLLGGADPRKPKKYNLKKEPANVRRFVELVQMENEEEDNIDNDITYFKSLSVEKQMALMKVLESKAAPTEIHTPLKFKILEKVCANPEFGRIAMSKYQALMNIDPSSTEYYKCSHWINGFTSLPLGVYKDLPVQLEDGPEKCQAFMEKVHKCMDDAIFGHDEAKLQILQFVSSWIANPKAHGNVLSIHGPPGVGKTSLIKDGVAKALDRPFHFITLGGATDASFLDGHSYTYEGSTWGKIADILIHSKCMNPVIYFDELDKISETPKGEEIMNMLIHITDGSQNDRFQDKYFTGINLDLSRCLFIFSHNNHERVNPILRDRMYNIAVKGFNTKEKLVITEKYIVNEALREVGLFEKVSFSKEMIQHIIEHYTGGEQGVRELKRCIQTVVSKINLLRFFNNPKQVPFAIEDFSLPFTIKRHHIEKFIKRKETIDPSIAHLYC